MRVGSSVGVAPLTIGLAILSGGLFSVGLAGCKNFDTCTEPGSVAACLCPDRVFGSRTCLPERIWGACDCSVEGLPDSGTPGMTGGAGGSMTGGAGGSMTGGVGGSMTGGVGGSMTGGVGGSMTGGDGGMDDSGIAMPDASDADSGGMAGVGGEPMGPAYAGCTVATVATDCRAGSTCLASDAPLLGTALHVCAPACSEADDCPDPEGSGFTAMLACVSGRCQLDCTTAAFATATTCPTGMTCTTKDILASYCYDSP